MDIEEARSSMRAVEESRDKVREVTKKQPFWYSAGIAVAIAALFALGDLHLPSWTILIATALYLVVIGALLAVVLKRSTVRPHRSAYALSRLVALTVAFGLALVVVIMATSLLAGVVFLPLQGTITGVVTALVFLVAVRLGVPRFDRWARREPA